MTNQINLTPSTDEAITIQIAPKRLLVAIDGWCGEMVDAAEYERVKRELIELSRITDDLRAEKLKFEETKTRYLGKILELETELAQFKVKAAGA